MASTPLISIVTPFLDVERYLAESIESVLAQSYDNWELILVDDGSHDASTAIALDYARRHPDRITLLEHPGRANLGTSVSRNAAAAVARGEWIAFLDADDVWVPEKLAEQARIVHHHTEVGLVMGATLYWRSWDGSDAGHDELVAVGSRQGEDPGCSTPQDAVIEPPRLLSLLYPLRLGAAAPSMNTVLVHADLLERVGGWESRFRTGYDDQALLAKLYLETPAYVSSSCWDRYRQRPNSVMARDLGPEDYDRIRRDFLEWFEHYLMERGLQGTEGWEHLQRALRRYRQPLRYRAARLTKRMKDRLKVTTGR